MDTCDYSCEPMDIDLSMNSVKSLDDSTSDKVEQQTTISPDKYLRQEQAAMKNPQTDAAKGTVEWNIKKFHLKKEHIGNKKPFLRTKVIVPLVVLCVSIGYYTCNISCIDELQLDQIKQTLTSKIYGQSYAVDKVIETLKIKASSKILFFYGGTGVGKTYTASLILKDSWNYSNVYHFTMPSFEETFTTNVLSGLILCKSTIMVVDNLSQNDLNISSHIKEVVTKSENLGKNITIILIYNCDTVSAGFVRSCNSSFLTQLKHTYREIKALKAFVRFETLTETDLKKCIEHETGHKHVSELQMAEILKNFDVTSDGCKGVQTKVKFLNNL